MKKNIIIAGGGFAGISALYELYRKARALKKDFAVTLIDNKDYFEFLPMLPDIIGGWLKPETIRADLEKITGRLGCDFIKDSIGQIDLGAKRIRLSGADLDYEYLVISTGSKTNFFNNKAIEMACLKLDSVEDALGIRGRLLKIADSGSLVNAVVIGGGYTGIEVITNILFLLKARKTPHKLFLVERSPEILMMGPQWMRKEAQEELKALGVEIICSDSLGSYADKTVTLGSGRQIKNAVCIWAAGVKTGEFIDKIDVEKERTRIKVDEDLTIRNSGNKNVFASGDTASFVDPAAKTPLRMAVMFSMGQGKVAAKNIVNNITGKPFIKYRPRDLGYLIPMAHGKAPGVVLGKNVHGFTGYVMHYMMCAYRSYKLNKVRVLRDVLLKRRMR